MVRRTILPALAPALVVMAFTSGAVWAQSKDDDPNQALPQKIREKLTAQAYEDDSVAPSTYVVSARDKDGNRVMMLISPTSTTVMKVPANPSTGKAPDKDEIIQQ